MTYAELTDRLNHVRHTIPQIRDGKSWPTHQIKPDTTTVKTVLDIVSQWAQALTDIRDGSMDAMQQREAARNALKALD